MAALGVTDPLWVVQMKERARYEEQFKSLNPENGVVTGEQAKGFFLQSHLPPNILGQIWALSDTDSDGKMDINEFSVACKLINLKLRGYQIPSTLPPALRNISTQFPVVSNAGLPRLNSAVVPQIPNIPVAAPPIVSPLQSDLRPHSSVVAEITRSNTTGTAPTTQTVQSLINVSQPPVIQNTPEPLSSTFPSSTLGNHTVPTQGMAGPVPNVPFVAPQVQPAIPTPSPTMSFPGGPQVMPTIQPNASDINKTLERKQSVESLGSSIASPVTEWAVPHQSKLKYTQVFNAADRARSGFLSGPQAKTVLIQTKLSQATLAEIWALADCDSDGRINCEEFVLAMHLCDMVKEGKPVPSTLPPELVPPAMRRKRGSSFSVGDDKQDVGLIQNNITFEDKRKENFDKGQAELERRRAVLMEAQRREQEEREKKEREEQEKREALKAEQEAKRQQDLQKQLQKQRELEQEMEEQRRRASEQREAARKELERQRQQEWEKARTQELEAQRMKEQNNVLKLKAKNQSLAIELATLTGNVKELSMKISDTRAGVSAVKATIDGMRATRDSHMNEMTAFKSKLKEQNQRLLLLAQEKARLESRNKISGGTNNAVTEQVMLAFTNKQITIKHLNEKLADLRNEVKSKTEDVENNNAILVDLKNQLKNLIDECETVYASYSEKRDAILQLKASNSGSSNWRISNNNWDSSASSWSTAPEGASWDTTPFSGKDSGVKKYRALYKFESRNPDELSFQPGDIISVMPDQTADPGWLSGELRGVSGWFPEAYVELIDLKVDLADAEDITQSQEKQPLEGILEVPETVGDKTGLDDGAVEIYVSVYRYESSEPGDLSFEQGEKISVVKKDGDWWTGVIGDRTGLFPSNYVEKIDSQSDFVSEMAKPAEESAPADDSVFSQGVADDVRKENTKSPLLASNSASGRETPAADFEQNKPVTPDFSAIPSAQTKLSRKGEVATVIAPYQATSSEQLSLTRGQLVCIRKKTTTGWWEGELQAKGKKKQIGWFPASYVKVMASRRLSQTTPDIEAEQNFEKVIAMFPYKALNEDELSFEKDDIITVLAKEEATWWKGESKGVIGLFPSNYVMPMDNQSRKHDPEKKLRQEAIQELLESERSYTADMALVRQVFEKPLSKSGLVTRDQLQKIFLNWREILNGNHALLRVLEERKMQSPDGVIDCIGDILCDNLPRMGAYVRFCSCQLSAGALLQQLTDSSPAFRELCRQCQRDPRTQGLPLSMFLVKPMQRITKYPLLIAKVLEHTPTDHVDRLNLEEALRRAEKLCTEVNEGVRENENSACLEWLQAHLSLDGLDEPLVFNSVTNKLGRRKFLHYGVLTKMRSGREIVGFLLSDCLVLAQPVKPLSLAQFSMDSKAPVDLKLYKKPLLVKEMVAQKSNESERGFIVSTPKGQLHFLSATPGETNQWIKHITLARDKFKSEDIQTHPFLHLKSEDGVSAGRLLVEIVEGYNLSTKPCLCEVRLNDQIKRTPSSGPPFKWNSSMQFLVRDTENDVLVVALFHNYDFKPNDLLDRGEIKIREILEQTGVGGPVLRKLAFNQIVSAEVHIKLDFVLFHGS